MPTSRTGARAMAIAAMAIGLAGPMALAVPIDSRVSGTVAGDNGTGQFVCFGTPTCTGSLTALITHPGCSNNFTFSSDLTITGLDLSHPGSPTGTVRSTNRKSS